MALEVKPSELLFDSVDVPSDVEIMLKNTYNNAVAYRFRLQSNAVVIENAKGIVEKDQTKTFNVSYDPEKNLSKSILMNAQLKYSELQDGKEGKEHTVLIPIRFVLDANDEDDMFESPQMPKWWEKKPKYCRKI